MKYTLWSHKIDILYNEEKQYWHHKKKEFQVLIRNHNEIKHIKNRYCLDQDICFGVITFNIVTANKAANDASFYAHIVPADKAANDVLSLLITFTIT